VFLARQLGKHQAGLTWNEVSRRYVDVDIEFFVPDGWRSRPTDGIKQGSGTEYIDEYYGDDDQGSFSGSVCRDYEFALRACQNAYDIMLSVGVAPEMARMILPQSMMVEWVWTGNLLSFFHVYRLRSGEGAQEEAKVFAELLKQAVEPIFPNSWKALENNAKTH
jgi:thymidylate synthase (FAD)